MDLIDWPYFFIRATTSYAIDRIMSLVIDGAILMVPDIAVNFSGLSL